MILKLGSSVVNHFAKRLHSTVKPAVMAGEVAGVSLKTVVEALENFAPKQLAESWDNTGLLLEPYTKRNITKVLLTNDLTEDVAIEATELGCEMIVSYHPPIFAPLKAITQSAWKERIVSLLLESRIALYSPHTSWDAVSGGVNDWLATAFPLAESAPILPGSEPGVGAGRLLKLSEPVSLQNAVDGVKRVTGLSHVRLAAARGCSVSAPVNSVALCAGSGASVLKGVKADLYLTGEMLHHDILDATQKGTSVILTNHSDSERGFLRGFSSNLKTRLDNKVQVHVSQKDKDPLTTV